MLANSGSTVEAAAALARGLSQADLNKVKRDPAVMREYLRIIDAIDADLDEAA